MDDEDSDWCWMLGDEQWYGLCPACGNLERVGCLPDEDALDAAIRLRERQHACGPEDLPDPSLYEEYYGTADLMRKMGFPEELI